MPNRFKSLLEILTQADVQFILIGGVAANLHGSARATFDFESVAELLAIKQEQEKE
jgi:hypothetical protein